MFEHPAGADPACEVRGQCRLDLRPWKPARHTASGWRRSIISARRGRKKSAVSVGSGMRKSLRNQLPVQRILGDSVHRKEPGIQCSCGMRGICGADYEFGVKGQRGRHAQAGPSGGRAQLHGHPLQRAHARRATRASEDPHGGHQRQSEAGGGGPGVPGRGCGQSGRRDHSSGALQKPDRSATPLAQAQAGGGAGHRAPQARQRDGSVLAEGANRRCVARGAVCSGLQHPVAAARHRAPGAQGPFVAPDRLARAIRASAICL